MEAGGQVTADVLVSLLLAACWGLAIGLLYVRVSRLEQANRALLEAMLLMHQRVENYNSGTARFITKQLLENEKFVKRDDTFH